MANITGNWCLINSIQRPLLFKCTAQGKANLPLDPPCPLTGLPDAWLSVCLKGVARGRTGTPRALVSLLAFANTLYRGIDSFFSISLSHYALYALLKTNDFIYAI